MNDRLDVNKVDSKDTRMTLTADVQLSSLSTLSTCVKRVQIRSFFWSVFSRMRTENVGKYGPEITPYLDTFHAVDVSVCDLEHVFLSWIAKLLTHFMLPIEL